MQHFPRLLCVLCLLCLCLAAPAGRAAPAREKVLLDTDMVEFFDDGVAMVMLANAPNIELLGVTVLSGNSWVEEGTAYALHHLAMEGVDKVPVVPGLEYPLRPQRHELFEMERAAMGMGHDSWLGSFGRKKPGNWEEFYRSRYRQAPTLAPARQHAVQFIIDTVRAHPGEVTIAAIGPCGNLALAVRMAPDIVPLIKRVVYMGGAFFQPGNVTPSAEFNWWFDPEAARIAVRTPFREQVIFGLDVCEKVVFRHENYVRLMQTLKGTRQAELFRDTFVGQTFSADPDFTHYVWDVLVAAYLVDPTLVTGSVTQHVDVCDQQGLAYGQSLAYPKLAPKGTQKAVIVTDIDIPRFWDMVNDPQYWRLQKAEPAKAR